MNAAPTTGLGETVLSSLNMVCRARGDQALWRGAGGLCPGRGLRGDTASGPLGRGERLLRKTLRI